MKVSVTRIIPVGGCGPAILEEVEWGWLAGSLE